MHQAAPTPYASWFARGLAIILAFLIILVGLAACEMRSDQDQSLDKSTGASTGTVTDRSAPPPQASPPMPAPPPPPAASPMPRPQGSATHYSSPAPSTMGAYRASPPPLPYYPQRETSRFPEADRNPVKAVTEQPVSTFSVDVDTASYAVVRRFLRENRMPPAAAVRVEEMVNYFPYGYRGPREREIPFNVMATVMPTPWNPDTQLLHLALKGYDIDRREAPALNLVLLIDVSGSMNPADRLPLLQQAFRVFANELRPKDRVAIVTYAGQSGVVLEPTLGAERHKIVDAIDRLGSGGSTAGFEGIRTAYELAKRHYDPARVNRIILATDGDFNVGITDPKQLESYIADQRKTGIYLTVLGVGLDNLNDLTMQKLAQAGNGNAAYIDSLLEARKVLKEELASTLFPIANDVKIQVEFNPARVAEYRLIGYETRALKREDFNNDQVDAGDIGSGHVVTAIYEITPAGGKRQVDPLRYGQEPQRQAHGNEIAFLKLRYKLPGQDRSRLVERPIGDGDRIATLDAAPADLRFAAAVAGFGQLLSGSDYMKGFGFADAARLAESARGPDRDGYRAELVQLIRQAETVRMAQGK